MGVSQKDRSERALRDVDELGKRPTSASSVERNSRPFAYSFWGVTPVFVNYSSICAVRLKKRCTRNFGKLICGRVGNPRERGYFSTLWGANSCAPCPRRFDLCPVPALPLEAGFQGGAAPLGVPQMDRSEKVLREVDELGKRPTFASSGERNSRPFAYSSWGATPVCTNYGFMVSDRLKKRCTRNFAKLICGRVGDPRERDYLITLWGAHHAQRARGGLICARSPL